jgi:hypothetical protein
MSKTRISDIGRRLVSLNDEKNLAFCTKPGYTWGSSTRTQPKQVSSTLGLTFILVGYSSGQALAQVQLCATACNF